MLATINAGAMKPATLAERPMVPPLVLEIPRR